VNNRIHEEGHMEDRAHSSPSGRGGDLWGRLDAFLQTDPHDAGCDATMEMLDVYAELLAAGSIPSERFPGVHAHLLACGPCAKDLEGLLAAITDETGWGQDLR
jgi:hypothetical protein